MKLKLEILPTPKVGIEPIQKCRLPLNCFSNELRYGDLAALKTNFGQQYIGRVFPIDLKYLNVCYIDSAVTLFNSGNEEISNSEKEYLVEVEYIEEVTEPIEYIEVDVVLNNNIFEYVDDRILLEDMVRHAAEPFWLLNNHVIKLNNNIQLYGMSNIIVLSSSATGAFRINSDTKINIRNVKMEADDAIRSSDLIGLQESINEINKLSHHLKLQTDNEWKLKPSLNALIIGATGSGKTSLCYNFLCENHCNVFVIKSSNVMRQYPGETEELLRNIFQNAVKFCRIFKPNDPIVIFIEDVNLICTTNSSSRDASHINRICSQFCDLLDEIYNQDEQIIVLATTSSLEKINPIVRRPGRFEKEISIPILNELQRKNIINTFLKKSAIKIGDEICDKLADEAGSMTTGFVGADLLLLTNTVLKKIIKHSSKKLEIEIVYEVLRKYLLEALQSIRPSSLKGTDVTVYKSDQTFSNLGGLEQIKRTLEVSILLGLRNPEAFRRLGLRIPKGILLYGPPGCAKTCIAKCLASEANMPLISISGAEVYSPYVGNAEKFISKVFDVARKSSPCLLFLDEIDTLVGNRSTSGNNDVQTRVLSTLLTEIDGIGLKIHSGVQPGADNNILVVGATNRPDMVDNALLRPGRFDKLIHVPPPDWNSRLEIFKIFKNKMPFSENVNIEHLANKTEHFSGADISNICNEAALMAFTNDFNAKIITNKDFDMVFENAKSSLTVKQIKWYCDFERRNIFS